MILIETGKRTFPKSFYRNKNLNSGRFAI